MGPEWRGDTEEKEWLWGAEGGWTESEVGCREGRFWRNCDRRAVSGRSEWEEMTVAAVGVAGVGVAGGG